jgi:predicted AlkP superfamily phosphohydrolase/phosphomutase
MEDDLGKVEITSMSEINSEKESREEAYSIFETRKKVFDWLREKDSDVYFTVFRLPDTMMHHTDKEEHMVEAYREVDDYVGEILDEAGEDDNVLVFSDHGAAYAENRFFLNTWLCENDFLTQKEEEENSLIDDLAMKAADIGQRLGLRDLLVHLNNITQDTIEKDFAPKKGKALNSIDFENTEAFSYMTGVCAYGGIWINDDRFEDGVVENTEKVKQQIVEELEQREEIVKVHRSEELYEEEVEMFPDLVAQLDERYKVALGFHPDITTKVGNYMHRKEGVLMVNRDVQGLEADLIDIAPTVLHLHGYPVPDSMDGKVLFEEGEVETQEEDVAGLDI